MSTKEDMKRLHDDVNHQLRSINSDKRVSILLSTDKILVMFYKDYDKPNGFREFSSSNQGDIYYYFKGFIDAHKTKGVNNE